MHACSFAGGVLDSLFLDYSSVKKLEKMPTKLELIRDAAIMIKKVRRSSSKASTANKQGSCSNPWHFPGCMFCRSDRGLHPVADVVLCDADAYLCGS